MLKVQVLCKNIGFKHFTNANSFFHLFLNSVNSSRKLTRVMWSFGSHSGQFLNYKPTRDVPSRPDSTWAAVQARGRTFWYVLFYKNLIVLHHVDNNFLFYFDICIKFTLSAILSTMKKWLPPIRAAEIVECVRKYMGGSSQNLQSLSSY